MSARVPHEMIKASAGSGKTYALVNRYLRLLALGESPARITALTFTRKAAGEFLQKIFLRLTEAAESETEAAKLSEEIFIEGQGSAFYRSLLAGLVEEIGHLQLGTIDHFFGRIVGAFPFELGLARPHRIMDEFEQDQARQATIEQLIDRSNEDWDQVILQLYKNLTWGAEEKRVYKLFDQHLKNYHNLFIETGEQRSWGNDPVMYRNPAWWMKSPDKPDALFETIEEELENTEMKQRTRTAFMNLLSVFREWQPGQTIKHSSLLAQLLDGRDELIQGTASVSYYRNVTDLPLPMGAHLHGLMRLYIGGEIKRKLLITKSLGGLLAEYDEQYSELIRETGSLVFADLPMLLAKAISGDASAISDEDLLYRLDSQTDHWLIDEFQDTSRIQWKVLSSFVDEVLQDPEGRRSFFYVGDIKQSIYGWRGGDARLFDEIFKYYHHEGSGIRQSNLHKSWRSAPPVLDAVNQFFGEGLERTPLPRPVLERWKANWKTHVPSEKTEKLAGYSGWGLVNEGLSVEAACVEVIKEVNPLARGLSCAVLVRTNTEVTSITQELREAGILASMEGRVDITMDNVVGTWIRAFLYSMARPRDRFSREFLDTTRLGIQQADYAALVKSFRDALTEDGYAEAIRVIISFLKEMIAENAFLIRRSEQILEEASRFTHTGQDSLDSFIMFMESASIEESSLHSQIQVMTVHKAKGLDFDMVVVAGFGEKGILRKQGKSLHVERDANGEIEWILDMPRKEIVQADSCLSVARESEEEQELFESLCLVYVAMTRARQGLYCLAKPYTGDGTTLKWQDLFDGAFSGMIEKRAGESLEWQYETGEANWYEGTGSPAEESHAVRLNELDAVSMASVPFLRLEASPSQVAHEETMEIHALRSTHGRRFGTRMHNFLATLEWIPFEDQEAVDQLIGSVDEDLRERFADFVRNPVSREVFQKPDRPCLLWREKPYALRDGEILTQGIIDRAHVFLDKDGLPEEIIILDYKTDQLDPDKPAVQQLEERYAKQLERYVEAVVVLTGLPAERVSTSLIPI